jgi:RHS repeat-associated protein
VSTDDATQVAALFPGNRWTGTGVQYDNGTAARVGNLTGLPGFAFGYDAENRQTSAVGGSTVAIYKYDGNGRRVLKVECETGTSSCTEASTGAKVTTYVYDASGKLAAEYATAPSPAPCTTCFLTADHLGSTRMMTDGASGLPVAFHDYLPFGEEIPEGIGGRGSLYGLADPKQKFTGKERDGETGLDYFGARYFSGAMGRFTSIDPIAMSSDRLLDPQQLNMYAYARNNPLKYVDQKGERVELSQLSEDDRQKLIAALQKESGLQLQYNTTTGLLGITGSSKGGSATYRAGLASLIGDNKVFNVLNQSEYSRDGQTKQVAFGLYDEKKNAIIIDFKDFSPKQPEMDLGLVFYHEGVAHGENQLTDSGSRNAWVDTLKVADELQLWAPVTHDVRQEGDRYLLRVGSPLPPNAGWFTTRTGKFIDVTDSMKPRPKQ